ncbi:MAG: Hsp20/alpha crystallin family protein [Cyanobacteria bacterium P01_H01_bin.15]
MTLVRWQPFRELDTLHREMNRLFDEINIPQAMEKNGAAYVPPAELTENENAIFLKLEAPGINVEDLNIEATTEAVSVSGERKSESRTKEDGYTRSEFRYGSFRRVIQLPVRVKNTDVEANYQDGILTLTLPKAEEEKNKVVKVNVA